MTEGSRSADGAPAATLPRFSAVVIHWNDLDNLVRLFESWDGGPEWELIVVDNSGGARGHLGAQADRARWVEPEGDSLERNLGFGGGANRGAAEARGDWLLILNPDARPEPGALATLAEATERYPDSGGLVPAMVDGVGEPLHRWQLQHLPSRWDLLRKTLPKVPELGSPIPPASGAAIEQPAAAVLMLRRAPFEALGGFDPGFHPAWYEDVDLARRYADRTNLGEGGRFRYLPSARFVHLGGETVGSLGPDYHWIHFRNLDRFLRKHGGWLGVPVLAGRLGMIVGALVRMVDALLRGDGVRRRGQLRLLAGVLSGFRAPRRLRELTEPLGPESGRGDDGAIR